MRIIDKVLKENHNLTKFEIIGGTCPSRWGLSLATETPRVLYPTTRNIDKKLENNNIITMAKKLCEEAVEVMEAVTIYEMGRNPGTRDKLIQELMDTVQMSLNILNYINGDIGLDMQEQIKLHNNKLLERGWEWDTELRLEIKEV